MKAVATFLFLSILALSAGAKEYKLYAMLLEDTPVELADGAKWMMDKGDTFPVLMYKEMQTKIVLQLAGTSFWVDTKRVRILKNAEVPEALSTYRRNVQTYLESKSKSMKSELERPSESAAKPEAKTQQDSPKEAPQSRPFSVNPEAARPTF